MSTPISVTITSSGRAATVPCAWCKQDAPAYWTKRGDDDDFLVMDPHIDPATGAQCAGAHKVL